tara:strand:- start:251 stop:661 length:411 start_codon:yes stop_codon:yes gene_type:complete
MKQPKVFIASLVADKEMNVLTQEEFIRKQAKLYCYKLNQNAYEHNNERDFLIMEGTRFLKVTKEAREAFAFIDKQTGDVYKAKSWSSRAKGIRYNLLHEGSLQALLKAADLYGGHLYMNEAVAAHIKVGSDIKEVV